MLPLSCPQRLALSLSPAGAGKRQRGSSSFAPPAALHPPTRGRLPVHQLSGFSSGCAAAVSFRDWCWPRSLHSHWSLRMLPARSLLFAAADVCACCRWSVWSLVSGRTLRSFLPLGSRFALILGLVCRCLLPPRLLPLSARGWLASLGRSVRSLCSRQPFPRKVLRGLFWQPPYGLYPTPPCPSQLPHAAHHFRDTTKMFPVFSQSSPSLLPVCSHLKQKRHESAGVRLTAAPAPALARSCLEASCHGHRLQL